MNEWMDAIFRICVSWTPPSQSGNWSQTGPCPFCIWGREQQGHLNKRPFTDVEDPDVLLPGYCRHGAAQNICVWRKGDPRPVLVILGDSRGTGIAGCKTIILPEVISSPETYVVINGDGACETAAGFCDIWVDNAVCDGKVINKYFIFL